MKTASAVPVPVVLVHSVSESPACTIPDVPTNVLPFEYENGVDESPTSSTLNKIPERVDVKVEPYSAPTKPFASYSSYCMNVSVLVVS